MSRPITVQLTRDPNGKFATRVLDFLLPVRAFAQGLTLSGEPVEGQLICGEEANAGEPRVVPLCAFTLEDGKAPNVVEKGTKAGQYWMVFTAQEVGQVPVKDSTTVTVLPGAVSASFTHTCSDFAASGGVVPAEFVLDIHGNPIPYRIVSDSLITIPGTVAGAPDARRVTFQTPTEQKRNRYTPIVDDAGEEIAVFDYTLNTNGTWRCQTWGLSNDPR
ncbi:MAG TPA: hypothetical protein VNO75_12355 [Gemmatimonadaceae bacterium]|nr:hypothetical protein [Gemmatimonadaceae bacterium]